MINRNKNKNEFSDQELINIIVLSGKTEYFSVLYDRYASFIYNKCYSFVDNIDEAKDLTHDVFIVIFLKLNTFKGESELFTWIYSVTLHTCIKYVKKKKNIYISFPELIQNEDSSIYDLEDDSVNREILFKVGYKRLQEILEKIPVEDKLLLIMKYQEDLQIKQICKILELKESTVKMRLLRAKKKVLTLSNI